MGKTGDTKRKIFEMLEHKSETLTSISNKLDLAPSTVSQHLNEMMDEGMIKIVDGRPRKWKYYEVVKNRGYYPQQEENLAIKRWKYAIPIAAIAIVLVVAALLYSSIPQIQSPNAQQVYLAPGSTVPAGSTIFSVSDSPTSYNITGLYVTVNSLSIRSASTGEWYNVPLQSNSFNLINLKNISQALSGIKLDNGIYDAIMVNITNITATVNGTNETVYLPSDKLTVLGKFNITDNTTNWINIDFNLEDSLHILKDGKIVMLPVLLVRHVYDPSLNVNQSTIVIAGAPGRIKDWVEAGMNMNGSMITNYSASQNMSIARIPGGGFYYNGTVNNPIIIRKMHGIVWMNPWNIYNASNYTNMAQNISTNSSIMRTCIRPPFQGGNVTPLSVNASGSNSSVAIHAGAGCCIYTIGNKLGGPVPVFRACYPITGPVPVRMEGNSIVGAQVSAPQLNNGIYIGWNAGHQANPAIVVAGSQNETMGCTLENGALQCSAAVSANSASG